MQNCPNCFFLIIVLLQDADFIVLRKNPESEWSLNKKKQRPKSAKTAIAQKVGANIQKAMTPWVTKPDCLLIQPIIPPFFHAVTGKKTHSFSLWTVYTRWLISSKAKFIKKEWMINRFSQPYGSVWHRPVTSFSDSRQPSSVFCWRFVGRLKTKDELLKSQSRDKFNCQHCPPLPALLKQ